MSRNTVLLGTAVAFIIITVVFLRGSKGNANDAAKNAALRQRQLPHIREISPLFITDEPAKAAVVSAEPPLPKQRVEPTIIPPPSEETKTAAAETTTSARSTPSTATTTTSIGGQQHYPPGADVYASWLTTQPQQQIRTNSTHRARDLPMAIALRQFRRSNFDSDIDGPLTSDVLCTLSVMQTRNCNPWTESLVECIARFGKSNWQKILGERCTKSFFWEDVLPKVILPPQQRTKSSAAESTIADDDEGWRKMKRGIVFESQMFKDGSSTRYVPPSERTYAEFPPPRTCKGRGVPGCVHYPIAFGMPRSYFVDKVPRTKSFDWMPMMPRHTPSDGRYGARIGDEDLFRELYSQSYFSWTAARAGVDAMRHYEIIAAGSIPFFFDLGRVPRNSVGHLPRKFLIDKIQKSLPGVDHIMEHGGSYTQPNMFGGVNFKKHGEIKAENGFNATLYYELADELLEYGKRHLSAPAVVAYMLRVLGIEEPGRGERPRGVLFFGRPPYDYLDVTLMAGFAELGIKVTMISSPKEYLFQVRTKDGTMTRQQRDQRLAGLRLHGAGFGFALRLPPDVITPRPFIERPTEQTRQDILDKKYDLILYSLTGDRPYYYVDEAKQSGTKFAFLQFRDGHGDIESPDMRTGCKLGGPVFIREMSDKNC